MKIVYLSNSIIPSRTANSIHVMKMCNSWSKLGYDVTLIAPTRSDKEEKVNDYYKFYEVNNNFEIIKINYPDNKKGGIYIYGIKAARVIRKLKPDIVYGRFLLGLFLTSLLKMPTIIELHHPFFGRKKLHDTLFNAMRKRKESQKIVVISDSLKDYFAKNYQIKHDKIMVAPDGADTVKNSIRKEGIRKKDKINVGYVGQLYKGKGMEIISQLAREYKDAHFHIVGGYEKDIIKWKSKTVDLKNITYYGFVPHSETSEYINACDIMIAPYLDNVRGHGVKTDDRNLANWMSPLKIFEYMAHGKPIITSDLPVLREVIKDNYNGVFCSNDNIDEWIITLNKLRNNKDFMDYLGRNAKMLFEAEFTWDKRAQNIIEFINWRNR